MKAFYSIFSNVGVKCSEVHSNSESINIFECISIEVNAIAYPLIDIKWKCSVCT